MQGLAYTVRDLLWVYSVLPGEYQIHMWKSTISVFPPILSSALCVINPNLFLQLQVIVKQNNWS